MRNMAANTISILIVAGIVLLVAIGIAKREYTAPGPLREEVIVVLPRGAALKHTSEVLALHGVIENEFLFRLGARYRREDRAIRYGEYLIPAGISMEEVLALLVRGETIEHKLTVAEGLTSYRIVEMLRASLILTGEIAEVPPEGSLAPDTYFIQRNQSRSDLLARMTEAQAAALAQAWEMRAPDLPLTSPEEVLLLASIVDKQTGVADERGRVASVRRTPLERGGPVPSRPAVVRGVPRDRMAISNAP